MKLKDENDVLDLKWRQAYIKQIESSENQERKNEALKRFEIYRDQTRKWVFKALKKQNLKEETLRQMEASVSNLSILKKVVNKLAKVYQTAPIRQVESDDDRAKIDMLEDELDFDTAMAKTNRYLELSKNAIVYVVPQKNVIQSLNSSKPIFDLKVKVLNSHAYDPILDFDNCEVARGFVLSDYNEASSNEFEQYTGKRSRKFDDPVQDSMSGVSREGKEYIFWTNLYHFTTNHKGEIIKDKSPEDLKNPVVMLPMISFNYDTDGDFWAYGGNDLVDGSIAINLDITNMTDIANIQGYGQVVVKGENIPSVLEFGPHTALVFKTNAGEEKPDVDVLSNNPPIMDWMSMIEQKVALLLSTNNLSPRNVATKLDATNFPSGISQLIEQSEVTFDIEDKQKIFQDNEPVIWEVIRRWMEVLTAKKQASAALAEIGTFKDSDVNLIFPRNKAVVTEAEKLDNLKKRQELGINSEIEILMIDNPDLSEEEAQEKLDKIKEEKQAKLDSFMPSIPDESEEDISALGVDEKKELNVDKDSSSDTGLVKNPNPRGRKKLVTKETADNFRKRK